MLDVLFLLHIRNGLISVVTLSVVVPKAIGSFLRNTIIHDVQLRGFQLILNSLFVLEYVVKSTMIPFAKVCLENLKLLMHNGHFGYAFHMHFGPPKFHSIIEGSMG